jgi:BA14K-like protein
MASSGSRFTGSRNLPNRRVGQLAAVGAEIPAFGPWNRRERSLPSRRLPVDSWQPIETEMAFVLYFFVLIVSAASVLFGLDLVTAPLPAPPNVPIGRNVRHIEKPALHDAGKVEMKARLDDRKLSPIFPASPPGPYTEIATTVTGAADAVPPATASEETQAQAEETQVQSDIQQTENRCDVRACTNAYVSFRASDCTYQPYDGPRRTCEKSDGATATAANEADTSNHQRSALQDNDAFDDQATARAAQPSGSEDEESDAARIVREMTRGQGEADIPVLSADGRIITVHTGGARAQASAACNVAACARAYNSFDASDCTYQPYGGPRRVCRR